MSTAQLEAFNWWLDQSREDRTASRLHELRGVPVDTASRWVTAFNKRLSREVERSVSVKLRHFVTEYEEVQRLAMEGVVAMAEAYSVRIAEIREMTENGEAVDLDEVGKLARSMLTIYGLAEKASCADVAKRQAIKAWENGSGSFGRGIGGPGSGGMDDLGFILDWEGVTSRQ